MTNMTMLEQDIVASRARLDQTIGKIQDRLTVSGIVDEVMAQAGVPRTASGHDYVLGLVRRNPLPVMAIAAGVGWLLYRMNKRREAVLLAPGRVEVIEMPRPATAVVTPHPELPPAQVPVEARLPPATPEGPSRLP